MLYIRDEVVNEWNAIQQKSLEMPSTLWIGGATGVGKSCAAFAFACGMVDRSQWDVLWFHYVRRGNKVMCVKFAHESKWTLQFHALKEGLHTLESILAPWTTPSSRPLIVFFDGYVTAAEVCRKMRDQLECWQDVDVHKRWFVCVTAMVSHDKEVNEGTAGSIEAENGKTIAFDTKFTPASWTQEEYLPATDNLDFSHSVRDVLMPEEAQPATGQSTTKAIDSNPAAGIAASAPPSPQELVEQQFYLAGGSAYAMFKLRPGEILDYLESSLNYAHDVVPYLKTSVGASSPQAVNRFFCRIQRQPWKVQGHDRECVGCATARRESWS